MFVTVIVFFSKKKMTQASAWVKKLQSYATIVPLSIFSLGKGRETLIPQILFQNFKILQVHLPTNPYNALV